jgi:predicted transcriptional regulator
MNESKTTIIFNVELTSNASDGIVKHATEKIQKGLRDNELEEKFLTSERKKLMEFLINEMNWKVTKVAEELGLTRQRVYKILSKEDSNGNE